MLRSLALFKEGVKPGMSLGGGLTSMGNLSIFKSPLVAPPSRREFLADSVLHSSIIR